MKMFHKIIWLSTIIFLVGCGLIPKRVEIGQAKVKAVPVESQKHLELIKQIADLDLQSSTAAYKVSLENQYTNLIPPLKLSLECSGLIQSHLGIPAYSIPWTNSKTVAKVIADVKKGENKHDQAMVEYAKDVQKLEGKKIEGTGWLQVPYFLYLGILLGVGFLLYFGLKVVSLAYPVANVGVSVARLSGQLAAKTVSQMVEGGIKFKDSITKEFEDEKTKNKIFELFKRNHQLSQDGDVQNVIQKLTKH